MTGSSRGIGAAIARELARAGARVAVHGRDATALRAVRADIERSGGNAIQVTGDVTRFREIEAMRRAIETTLGPIEILVANAGGSFTKPGPLEEVGPLGIRVNCIAPETILTERNEERIPAEQKAAMVDWGGAVMV